MKKSILLTAVVCLLLAGCGSLGGASPGLAGGKLWPGGLKTAASDRAFIEEVENDPFPEADQVAQVDLKVAGRR